jgi:hypothetical protein
MTPIVERFVTAGAAGRADAAPGAGPGNAAGGRAATNSPGSGHPKQYYIDWLAALKTLDFDRFSRNAQVDYLFIRNASERYLARRYGARSESAPQDRRRRIWAPPEAPGISRSRGRNDRARASSSSLRRKKCGARRIRKASTVVRTIGSRRSEVKGMHIEPGRRPAVLRPAFKAVDYVRKKDLITVRRSSGPRTWR